MIGLAAGNIGVIFKLYNMKLDDITEGLIDGAKGYFLPYWLLLWAAACSFKRKVEGSNRC